MVFFYSESYTKAEAKLKASVYIRINERYQVSFYSFSPRKLINYCFILFSSLNSKISQNILMDILGRGSGEYQLYSSLALKLDYNSTTLILPLLLDGSIAYS